jgi:undecaprenyl-diphosphatase
VEIWEILLLAVVQGITEFLPISSSGHLALLQHAMGITEAQLLVAVVLHAGTLLSILVYYFKDLMVLARLQERQTSLKVIGGTIPLVIIGLPIHKFMSDVFANYWVAVGGLCFTAFMLLIVHRDDKEGTTLHSLTWKQAILTGLAQCIAILPGVSRSGSTIATAGRLGVNPTAGASFSFFLAVPAISGACLMELKDWHEQGAGATGGVAPSILLIGFFASFVVGYFSLRFLISLLKRGQFRHFGYYCLFAATLAAILKLV